MNFSEALTLLKEGRNLTRKNWVACHLFIVPDTHTRRIVLRNFASNVTVQEYIAVINIKQNLVVPWMPTNNDLLANDWMLY